MLLGFLLNHLKGNNIFLMKKLLLATIILISLTSCGGPDGTAEDTDGLSPENHRIFVSSASYPGNFGNLTTADLKCKGLAELAGLTRKYKAILSTSSEYATNRLNFTGSLYIFTSASEKLLVAASISDIWGADTKSFLNKVNYDENYTLTDGVKTWTGTDVNGGVANDNCSNWTTTAANSWYGETDKLNDQWIESNIASCTNSYRIYCVSQ